MELPVYEGGSGGKFRRRPFRRSPVTPYDRPPSAARSLRGLATSSGSGSGWLSKLVDPASRFIAGSTSRIFSTVFRKRLPAPTEVQGSEQNCQVNVPEAADVALTESKIQATVDGHNTSNDFGTTEISEIEQLVKQNTYTRAQVDYLTELLCSRTFEPSVQQFESNAEKVIVSKDENGERNTSLNKKLTSETALTIPPDVAASPAEIAKAYMSSRLPKASSSALSLQSRVFQKDKSLPSSGPCAPKPNDLSIVPRSVLHIPEVNELSSGGYPTSKFRGRSAMYRMSRSPYFKVSEYTHVTNAGSSSLQRSPGRTSNSDSRQVLKRGSSFLDGEDGSLGHARRIRQKFDQNSVSTRTRFMPSGSHRSSSLAHLDKDDFKDPTSSQKPCSPNEMMYASTCLQNAESSNDKIFSSSLLPPIPRQSSEACRKILEQLDKFAPSREGKSNMRTIAMDELPSKLTTEMLNGRALRSMDNVDTSQFTSIDIIGASDHRNVDGLKKFAAPQSEEPSKTHKNDPLKVDALGVKFETAANGTNKQDTSNKSIIPNISSSGATNHLPATARSQRKPAFQMMAPEDLLEVGDDQEAVDVSAHSTLSFVKTDSKIAETEASVLGTLPPENTLLLPSKYMDSSSSVSFPEISKKSYDVSQVSEKDKSFRFPVAIESSGLSLPALTPKMPFSSHDKPLFHNEQTVPTFMFGSRNSDTPTPSSTTAVANESPIESKPDLSWPSRMVQLEGSSLFSNGKSEAYVHKSPGIVASSGLSSLGSTDSIAFGSSITSTQGNGSVLSSPLTYVLSTSTPEANPKPPVSLFSSNSKLVEASTSSLSTTLPVFSSTTMFSFGAAASTAAPVSVSLSSDKSVFEDSEGKDANKSPLGSSNPATMQASSAFLMGSSNTLMAPSSFPDPGSTPCATNPVPAQTSIFSQVSSSGSGLAAPPSSSAINGSSQNTSTKFGSAGGSIFGVQEAQSGSYTSVLSQSSTSQPGSFPSAATLGSNSSSWPSSSAFGMNGSSSPGFGQMSSGTINNTAKSFGSSSGFSFTSSSFNSSSSGFSFSSGNDVSSTSSPFSFISSESSSSSGLSSTNYCTSNSGFLFSANASSCNQSGNALSQATASGLLVNSSPCSTSSISNSVFGSLPPTGFSFGLKAPASNFSSFSPGSSSGSVFSFTSSGASMSATTASPVFGMASTSGGFSSTSPNNDQMNVEDTMADDTNQISGPIFPAFGQPSSTPASSSFLFGSTVPSGGTSVFQFGSQQNPSILQNANPFQAGSNLDFAPGGSFSLGSGGGEKSARKIVKVRRDKIRRK